MKDAERPADVVSDLVEAIDMKASGAPVIEHVAQHTPAVGYSLVQLIALSDITGRFCDLTGDADIDIFSWRSFNPDIAVDVILDRLGARSVSRTVIMRQAARPQTAA